MKKTYLSLFLCFSAAAFGQPTINVDNPPSRLPNSAFFTVGRVPFNTVKYIRVVAGTPYFSDNWMLGTIMAKDSSIYGDIRLKLDLIDGTLIYLNDMDEEMESVSPILEVSLTDTLTGITCFFIHSSALRGITNPGNDKTWYQMLTGDAVPLYKQYFKDIYESKPYGSSVTEQNIRTSERFFIVVNKSMVRVKKLKEIPDILPEKRSQLEKFIAEKKLDGKKDEDYISLMKYYNSIN